jgi:hypothetical protein
MLCYSRNLNITTNDKGLLCDSNGFPLFPEISVDIGMPYQIEVEFGKLKIKYNDLTEKQINLYWPKQVADIPEYSDIFYFSDVELFSDARVISGFLELSAVDIQLILVKMLALVPAIEKQYNDVVFFSGSASNTIQMLNSLFILSYLIKAESAFKNIPLLEYYIDMDLLRMGDLWVFLQIKAEEQD